MKKLLVFITLSLFCTLSQAQTDFDIAKQLIGKNISTIDTLLTNLELEYYITFKDEKEIEFYLVKNNSVRVWGIKYSDIYTFTDKYRKEKNMMGEKLIYDIFVRYRHNNINDLREFFTYEIPKSTKYMIFEKSLGKNISHMKVIHVGFQTIVNEYY